MWQYVLLWIIVSAIALGIDLITSSFLFVWFTVGGIVAIVLALFNYTFVVQLITFIGISSVLMAIGYPIVKRTIKKTVPMTPTMEEKYIGDEFHVDSDVNEKATIKFQGIYWTVKNEGEEIKKGDKVKIVGIEGNRLVIKKIN